MNKTANKEILDQINRSIKQTYEQIEQRSVQSSVCKLKLDNLNKLKTIVQKEIQNEQRSKTVNSQRESGRPKQQGDVRC